uniref:Uncharacterized protein n=1 Tax=Knipowitschia caucasica TaxID=637954 RepID=A0AAV2KGB2_KNICA
MIALELVSHRSLGDIVALLALAPPPRDGSALEEMRSVKREQRASKTGRPHPSHLPTNKVTWVPVRAEQRRPAPSSSSSITLSIIIIIITPEYTEEEGAR